MLRTATSRMITAHLALFSLSTALVLAVFTWQTTAIVEGEAADVLKAEVEGLAEQYAGGGVLGLARAIERRLDRADERDAVYLLTDAYGEPLTGNLAAWPPTLEAGQGELVELELYRTDRDRAAEVTAATFRLPGGERLLVGRDAQARVLLETALFEASVWATGLALLLSLLTGWLFSRFVLGRIGEIRRAAGEIISGDLSRRVPLRGTEDEFDRLNRTLNAMLDRIEALVGNLRTVTDSLAHDLRSPLTRLRALTAEFADPELDEAARRRLAARATAETEGMLRVFSALIEISRAEAGVGREAFERIDLGALAADVADLFTPAADDREVEIIETGGGGEILGHPQLVAQALSNLLDNALRYAPPGSRIEIESRRVGPKVRLAVSDAGPGIPEAERARVLERFVTLDPSRGRGSGLGLALVAAVAKLHGGEIALRDAEPGLTVALTFDAAPEKGKRTRGMVGAAGIEPATPTMST